MPGTHRPILFRWFSRFADHYPDYDTAVHEWRRFCLVILLLPTVLALLNYFLRDARSPALRFLTSRFLWLTTMAVALLLWRFPVLLLNEMNPDETLFLGSARKLFLDPLFFRSVDTGTSGPLNIYPLMLPAIFGFSPDYASSRLVGLTAMFLALLVVYRAFAHRSGDRLARIAVLPLFGMMCVVNQWDLLHFSSEDISVLLLAIAFYVFVRLLTDDGSRRDIYLSLLGFLTSAGFFAKMQSLPLLFAVGLIALTSIYTDRRGQPYWRPVAAWIAGSLPLPLTVVVICLATGQWTDFWGAYVLGNRGYVQTGLQERSGVALARFGQYLMDKRDIRLYLFTALAMTAAWLARVKGVRLPSRMAPKMSAEGWMRLLSFVLVGAALFSIYVAHRLFSHYLVLLILPVGLAMACSLLPGAKRQETSQPASLLASILFFVALTLAFQTYVGKGRSVVELPNDLASVRSPDGAYVASLVPPDGRIVVWGWNGKPFLSAGRQPATRDLNMSYLFNSTPPVQAYYRERFLRDLKAHPADLFIDAVGPASCCHFDDPSQRGYRVIPEIRQYIDSHFVKLVAANHETFYVSQRLASRLSGTAGSGGCATDAVRCLDDAARKRAAEFILPLTLPAISLPDHAAIEVTFVPTPNEETGAAVLGNSENEQEGRGFELRHVGGGEYRVRLGIGQGRWVTSRPLAAPAGVPTSIAVEITAAKVTVRLNGATIEQIQLPGKVVDSPGAIYLSSPAGSERPFHGIVQSFQILVC
jgi:hypothetical protein